MRDTNYFGGVWIASVLADVAAKGQVDIMMKYNTRQYFGLIDNNPEDRIYFRTPAWFAVRLLYDIAGMKPGASMCYSSVDGPMDSGKSHLETFDTPWVGAYAVNYEENPRIIVINRSFDVQKVDLSFSGIPLDDGQWKAKRYVFNEHNTVPFIGRMPMDYRSSGRFEGAPDDSPNEASLKPMNEITFEQQDGRLILKDYPCSPISISVFELEKVNS